MEFNTDDYSFFEQVKQKAGPDLVGNWYVSPVIDLPQTSDDAAFVAAPVYGSDGTFYGVCGREISKDSYGQRRCGLSAAGFDNVVGLLAHQNEAAIQAKMALTSSSRGAALASSGDNTITSNPCGALLDYQVGVRSFVGLERAVALSPLDGSNQWRLIVMIPREDYQALARGQNMQVTLGLALIFAVAALAALRLAEVKTSPNAPVIEEPVIVNQTPAYPPAAAPPGVGLLLDYLAEQEVKKERAEQGEVTESLLEASYKDFTTRLASLTVAERGVFDLYAQELTSRQIAETQGISINTVKFHNKNIYTKLSVSSRKELLLLAKMMLENKGGEYNGSL
jgi:DNA-binding CsgD family transcriptional regulator